MFGLARVGHWSAWGTSKPSFSSEDTISAAISGTISNLQSYNFAAKEVMANANYNEFSVIDQNAFDDTGVVIAEDFVLASTFKIPADVEFLTSSDTFTTLNTGIDAYNSDGFFGCYANIPTMTGYPYVYWEAVFGQVAANPPEWYQYSPGSIGFRISAGGYQEIIFDGITVNDIADTWTTVVVCMSEDTNSFANWNSDGYGNRPMRALLINAETATVIAQSDVWYNVFQEGYEIDFTGKAVRLSLDDPDSNNWTFRSRLAGITSNYPINYDPSDIRVSTGWFALGETIDPTATTNGIENWRYLTSPLISETVGGVQAWINFGNCSSSVNGTETELYTMRGCRANIPNNIFGKRTTDTIPSGVSITSTDAHNTF